LGARDEDYVRSVEKKIVGAIHEASMNKRDSVIRVGKGRCNIEVNRREMTKEGKIILGEESTRPYRPDCNCYNF
jgi:hypothetical protein